MKHCPHLTKSNSCEVASNLAGCNTPASAGGCTACQNDPIPQNINVVTIGMALVQRKRLGRATDELKKLLVSYKREPATDIAHYTPGPGSELKKMLAWFARSSTACDCDSHAETMNEWGADGCRENIDTILDWLMEEAHKRGLPHGRFTRVIARSLVDTAIRRYERKYPDGPPESGDNED